MKNMKLSDFTPISMEVHNSPEPTPLNIVRERNKLRRSKLREKFTDEVINFVIDINYYNHRI